jgi:hypothetical protein
MLVINLYYLYFNGRLTLQPCDVSFSGGARGSS